MKRRRLFANLANLDGPREPLPQSKGWARFPNALLRTHEDKQVRFYDDLVKGKQAVVNLMYATCEGFCPVATANLVKVHNALKNRFGRDLFLYSLTVKPEEDDPAALKNYAQMHHALLPGWTFLTGDPYDIETIRFRLFRWDHIKFDLDVSTHVGMLRIVNDNTNRWLHSNPFASLTTILQHISWADPPKTREQLIEENRQLQEKIDKDVKMYGYRKTV